MSFKEKAFSGEILVDTSKLLSTLLQENMLPKFESINVESDNINDLILRYKENNLVLVLGAGVSVEYNLPDWNLLLQQLLIGAFSEKTNEDKYTATFLAKLFSDVFKLDPLISGRYLQNHYKTKGKGEEFIVDIKKVFYGNIKEDFISKTFKEIINLCVAPGNSPNLNSIITYNYDDILETHLEEFDIDIPYKSIYKIGENHTQNELPIYHVHGFLSRTEENLDDSEITLSEDGYHKQYNDIYSWNNIVQINKFRENTCLFIGISLSDPNTRRLLDIANQQRGAENKYHYIIKRRYERSVVKKSVEFELSKYGNSTKDNELAIEIDKTVEHLARFIENFEEEDALSLGIKTIWIEDFEQISDILKKIRTMKIN